MDQWEKQEPWWKDMLAGFWLVVLIACLGGFFLLVAELFTLNEKQEQQLEREMFFGLVRGCLLASCSFITVIHLLDVLRNI